MTTPQQSSSDGMLAQILLKQGEMGTQLAVISEQLKAVPDHEGRIRKLEAWRYGLPLSGVIALGSLALSIYEIMHK